MGTLGPSHWKLPPKTPAQQVPPKHLTRLQVQNNIQMLNHLSTKAPFSQGKFMPVMKSRDRQEAHAPHSKECNLPCNVHGLWHGGQDLEGCSHDSTCSVQAKVTSDLHKTDLPHQGPTPSKVSQTDLPPQTQDLDSLCLFQVCSRRSSKLSWEGVFNGLFTSSHGRLSEGGRNKREIEPIHQSSGSNQSGQTIAWEEEEGLPDVHFSQFHVMVLCT